MPVVRTLTALVVLERIEVQNEPKLTPKEEIIEATKEIVVVADPLALDCLKSSPETLKSIKSIQPCSNNDDDDDEEEDDPYERCERILIDESDSNRFRTFIYSGPDVAPTIVSSPKKMS